jgi:hypothetical protein
MIAVSFSRSGWTPSGPTVAPVKVVSVMKSLYFVGDRDSFCSRQH